jgi:hypothetical protein
MPRIARIHFASLGHHDARVPALTLDMRDRNGQPADTVIWAENGTGKSSLLNLIFSTYRPNQRQFLGKQAEGKARELTDYVRERDLAFVITEWDISDDQAQASLLADGSQSLLVVGQLLSWRGLDKSNELRRLFFTLRPNHVVQLQSLPVLGLGTPVASFEAFRDWLDEQNRAFPRLEIRYTTNQSEWQEHLANHRLDPELFTYQLRMNEGEGGINNLFNTLKSDRDFIRLFLQLGFDPISANQVRDNLQQFLPKLRNRAGMELQLEFNESLLQQLNLFVSQLAIWRDAQARSMNTEQASAALLASLRTAAEKLDTEAKSLADVMAQMKGEETRLTSQRAAVTRKQNYFRNLKCRLEEEEARAEFQASQERCAIAERNKKVVEMAVALAEISKLRVQSDQLRRAIEREREQARPGLEALQQLGGRLKCKLDQQIAVNTASILAIDNECGGLRKEMDAFRDQELRLAAEYSEKKVQLYVVEEFFSKRETERDRLRQQEWVESKETADVALQTWIEVKVSALQGYADAHERREAALREKDKLAEEDSILAQQIAQTESETTHLAQLVHAAEVEEKRIATHQQMRAATESVRAELNLPQTAERLTQRSESLFRRILRVNVEAAEDQRSRAYFDKYSLFPPHRDVEVTVEKLNSAGVGSATTSANWLAYNVADPKKAAEMLIHDPSRFSGVMFDNSLEGEKTRTILPELSTEQIPVTVSAFPAGSDVERQSHQDTNVNNNKAVAATVLPRHAGTFNFEVARAEAHRLEAQQQAQAQELETLKTDLAACRTLLDDLQAWTENYGGAKIRILRERARASGQALEDLRGQRINFAQRKEKVESAIKDSDAILVKTSQIKDRAGVGISQLQRFLDEFEIPYESNSARRLDLTRRLQSIEVEQLSNIEARKKSELREPVLQNELVGLKVRQRELENEVLTIRYALLSAGDVEEPLDELRSSYEYEVKQFEGTFLTSQAQGELRAAEQRIIEGEKRIARDFKGVNKNDALLISNEPDRENRIQYASEAVTAAHQEQGKAKQKLEAARGRLVELGGISEQDRAIQVEIIPRTSQGAAEELAKLENQHAELQARLEQNRTESEQIGARRGEAEKQASSFNHHVQRLSDLSLPETTTLMELPNEGVRITALVNETISGLQRFRKERDIEHGKLQDRYSAIQDLTRDERYAKAADLPARGLFAHMPCGELMTCAVQKGPALEEEIKTIRADLELMAQHRETLVTSLLNVSKQAIRLLRRAERWSTMPADMAGWESEPFLRIRLFEPPGEHECRSRLKWLVDSILEDGKIPAGIELVFQGIMALVGETGIDATILKPETQRRKVRYPVREMGSWSEGERTTVAILLYCTLVKIRSQSRGKDAGQNQVSALLLDNPLGPCSKPEFLKMHRHIAGQLGVQLIYATGINDPPALSVFPNWIRLAKNRIVSETGELAIGLVGQHEDSTLMGIRIFEGQEKG